MLPSVLIREMRTADIGGLLRALLGSRTILWTLVLCSVAASAYYFRFWVDRGVFESPALAVLLVLSVLLFLCQVVASWVVYLFAGKRRAAPPCDDVRELTVDVFVTACGESPELVERSLRAATEMSREHRTFLLDDGADPRLRRLAESVGARYIARTGNIDRKAGNLNHALSRTDGDIVVVFDVDHVPERGFLEESLGHFRDPAIGFVQVMVTYSNEGASFIAMAASEALGDFFSPTCLGMDRLGSATMIGSNALIRRRALEDVGGYRPGLAEDLATSIELHAAGWRSAYVPFPLAPGLPPQCIRGWFTQQLKWARGVVEVLLTQYPSALRRLTPGQNLCYLLRMTYYSTGLVIAAHLAATLAAFQGWFGASLPGLEAYLKHALPLGVASLALRHVAFLRARLPGMPWIPPWRATALVYSTWPVYCAGWIMGLLRWRLSFRATPKNVRPTMVRQLSPQLGALALLSYIAVCVLLAEPRQLSAAAIALAQAGPQAIVLSVAISGVRRRADTGRDGMARELELGGTQG